MFSQLPTRLLCNLALVALTACPFFQAFAGTEEAAAATEDSSLFLGNFSMLNVPFAYSPDNSIRYDGSGIKAGLLYDVQNKKIVWQKEMDKALPIASLTKMMVALIAVEEVKAGTIHWDDDISWVRDLAVGKRRKKKIVHTPVTYTLHDLFKAAMIASNNEASEQMARYIGKGDLRSFIERMNKRALELGMNSTFYSNPTGLPASVHSLDNSSTPVDLLTLALEMVKYPEILEVTGMGYADVQNGHYTQQLRNHNRLAIEYSGEVDGMKTGYTRRAGFCLVATSNKCEYRLISVALGSQAPGTRNEIVKDLINEYYTSVGLDRLGPYCHAPADLYASGSSSVQPDSNSDFIYKTKQVRKTHTVQRGEHLAVIAGKYNCSVVDLKRWNRMRTSRLIAGQKLKIYSTVQEKIYVRNPIEPEAIAADDQENTEEASAEAVPVAKQVTSSSDESSKYVIYTVQPGDTLFNISKRYEGSTVQMLKKINKINDIRSIKVGTRLKVPVNS